MQIAQTMIDEYAAFAHQLADLARPIAKKYFRTALNIEAKEDFSPVTIADRAIEARLRAEIRRAYPDHGILGEEEGGNFEHQLTWVVDPIDGTKSFITGMPLFGTLIALTHHGQPILGVIDMPALGERWDGHSGKARHGDRSTKSSERDLGSARLFATSPDMFSGAAAEKFSALSRAVGLRRFGGDCYAYGLLASGHIDLVVEAGLQVYDVMALVPIIEGAGGVVTDWQGRPISPNFDGHLLAAANPELHAAALVILRDTNNLAGTTAKTRIPGFAPSADEAVAIFNEDGHSPFLLVCDHASNFIPAEFGTLGLQASDLTRHIAWDPGASSIANLLMQELDAALVESRISRLVIDCNRPLDAPDLIWQVSETTTIPGNVNLSEEERQNRIDRYYAPFHDAIDTLLEKRLARGQETWVVSLHSFTPVFKGVSRPWQIGIIHDSDMRLATPLIGRLQSDPMLTVGINQPYSPDDRVYFTIEKHARSRELPCAMIEIRNDEIRDEAGQKRWAVRLADAFRCLMP